VSAPGRTAPEGPWFARLLLVPAILVLVPGGVASAGRREHGPAPPVVVISLDYAREWLEVPECRAIYDDFSDARGRPLSAVLRERGLSPAQALKDLTFEIGDWAGRCQEPGVVAFTAVGTPVVKLCLYRLVEMFRRDPREATAIVLHEQLHTLGLGENPPSSREITLRILERCGVRRPAQDLATIRTRQSW
jgi:hypothetical protein